MEQVLICYSVNKFNQNEIFTFQEKLVKKWKKNDYSPYYKEKALILILAYLLGSNREINRTNAEYAIQVLAFSRTELESYPLYRCIVEEDVSSILSPADISFLTSPIGLLPKILIIFEHIMDF